MAVVKARGCKHEFDTREFTIGQGGINLLPLDRNARNSPRLPIEELYLSVLSRAAYADGRRQGLARAAKSEE